VPDVHDGLQAVSQLAQVCALFRCQVRHQRVNSEVQMESCRKG
jgi:hypothetical protein